MFGTIAVDGGSVTVATRTSRDAAPTSLLSTRRAPQLYEQIRDQIIAQVVAGVWQPGQSLPSERDLARLLGVSRPSIREALAALSIAGIVEIRRGSGSRIVATAREVLEQDGRSDRWRTVGVSPLALLEARLVIEPATARLAAAHVPVDPELETHLEAMRSATDLSDPAQRDRWTRADRLFHKRIAYATGNPVFARWAEEVFAIMDQPLWRQLGDSMLTIQGRMESSVAEHLRILEAIRDGQPEAAARVASDHVRKVRHFMGLD
jgi:DNA-binding FadR family transcriptional regulator